MSLAVEHILCRASFASGGGTSEGCGEDAGAHEPSRVASALQDAKRRVPQMRQQMGEKAWRQRVDALTVLQRRPPPYAINRAYAKLREIMETCALHPPKSSLHLGEAPGGFVQYTSDACKGRDWSWTAVSLPTGPPFDETRLPMRLGRIIYADLLAGDEVMRALGQQKFDLVTADAAAEMDHDRLEAEHLPLLRAQAEVLCMACAPGGNAVLKFYEGCETGTLATIASISHCFESLSLIKPKSSRPVNSERYLVARGRVQGAHLVRCQALSREWAVDTTKIIDEMIADQLAALEKIFRQHCQEKRTL